MTCSICKGSGYKDGAAFAMDPCVHDETTDSKEATMTEEQAIAHLENKTRVQLTLANAERFGLGAKDAGKRLREDAEAAKIVMEAYADCLRRMAIAVTALAEVKAVLDAGSPAITDTIWCTVRRPAETLRDFVDVSLEAACS